VSKTRASWNHRNDRSRESGRNRSFALCSRALDDLINGPKYSDILLLGNCHPTTCPNPVWGEVKKMSRQVALVQPNMVLALIEAQVEKLLASFRDCQSEK